VAPISLNEGRGDVLVLVRVAHEASSVDGWGGMVQYGGRSAEPKCGSVCRVPNAETCQNCDKFGTEGV